MHAARPEDQPRQLLDTLDREGRAHIPISGDLDPTERAAHLLRALRIIQLAEGVRPGLIVSAPTGEELGKPEAAIVLVCWLERDE